MEARVEALGQGPLELTGAIADLERRVEENSRELAILYEHITEAERRAAAESPAMVEQQVAARVEDLRGRFASEIEQSRQRTIEMFERTIDEKISTRIGSSERSLAVQADAIGALSARTAETDSNLQKLVAAIEKLCERAQFVATAPELSPEPTYGTRLPFESQMDDAMGREPVVPVIRTAEPVAAEATPDQEPKKTRFLFRSLIVAGFSLLTSRFLR